jgi:predicted nucleic acid-binding protein
VIEVVLDTSVLVKWFKEDHEAHLVAARALRERYLRGELVISAPPLLFVELLNIAARRWGWDVGRLDKLAERMSAFGFRVQQPPLRRIAYWAGQGLTAYDACYVALAEELRSVVITADDLILAVAGGLATPVVGASSQTRQETSG